MNFSNYLEEKILTDNIINDNVYLAIFGNLPGESKTADEIGMELEYNDKTSEIIGYDGASRQELLYTTVGQDNVDDQGAYIESMAQTKNDNLVTLTGMPECTVMAAAVMDAMSAGNVLMWVTIAPKSFAVGASYDVKAEQFILKTD